jgi:hypothetical protein
VTTADEALAWLAEVAHENLGTEIALRAGSAGDVVFARRTAGPALAGVSVATPGGQWFLEADGQEATADLVAHVAGAARAAGRWPAKATTSGKVKRWLRPLLAERGVLPSREHDLLAMACRKIPGGAEGRWATLDDRPALECYQQRYNEERRTTVTPDWSSVLRRRAVAVLERDGQIVASSSAPRTPPATRPSAERGPTPRGGDVVWRGG